MIEIRDLTLRYPGEQVDALAGVTLDLHEGTFVAVMGSNGSGKSTLARSLNGLLRPSAGEVVVDGHRTSDADAERYIRSRVGIVFQNPHLQTTSLTVEREIAFGLQNIGIHSDELRRRVDEQLSFAGLHEVRERPPRTLSGGEQQRLALAAVLAMRPTYLVLDEATSLLSPESRTRLLHEVDRERTSRGTTVILITQFAEEALLADRLIILHSGRIALDAPPPAVFNSRAELEQWSLPAPSMMRRGHEP